MSFLSSFSTIQNFNYSADISHIEEKIQKNISQCMTVFYDRIEILNQKINNLKFELSEANNKSDKENLNLNSKNKVSNFLFKNNSEIWSLIYIEKKNLVLLGDSEGIITKFDLKENKIVAKLRGHSSHVNCIAILNGNKFASSGDDSKLQIWDSDGDYSLFTLKSNSPIYTIIYLQHYTENYLSFGDYSNTITVFNFKNFTVLFTINTANDHYVRKLLYLEGDLILSAGFTDIKIFELKSKNKLLSFDEHKVGINDIVLMKSSFIASLGEDNLIKIWSFKRPDSFQTINLSNLFYRKINSLNYFDDYFFISTQEEMFKLKINENKQYNNHKIVQNYKIQDKINGIARINSNNIIYYNWQSKKIFNLNCNL